MICLQRISDEAILQSWASVSPYFACPIGEVHGATVGWESDDYRLIEVADPEPDPPTVGELKAYAAAKRWAVETGGIVLPGGVQVTTDDASQRKIAELRRRAEAAEITLPFGFKAASGWVDLDLATIQAVDIAVAAHVQASYATERSVSTAIDAGTITTLAAVDAAAWPSNS